jgi:hypothetical protein
MTCGVHGHCRFELCVEADVAPDVEMVNIIIYILLYLHSHHTTVSDKTHFLLSLTGIHEGRKSRSQLRLPYPILCGKGETQMGWAAE